MEKLFKPKSVALVGATERPGAFGYYAAVGLLDCTDKLKVYLVNNKSPQLFGVNAYKSLDELPECPDVVEIATPAGTVNGILEQAGKMGVKYAVIFSSGFSEAKRSGGVELENEMLEVAKRYGIRVVGPNGIGIMNNLDRIKLWGQVGDLSDKPCGSGAAVLAQSGGYAQEVMMRPYINLAYAISCGNGNDITIEELAEYCLNDKRVTTVAMYVEGFKKPEVVFRMLARAAELNKPVIILKSGRSAKGAISAASHTGNLAGSNEVFDAIFEKYGVVSADSAEEFYSLLQVYSIMGDKRPGANKYAVINRSGGETTLCADMSERCGVELPDLCEETKNALSEIMPAFATLKNPLDMTAGIIGDKEYLSNMIRIVSSDPGIDTLVLAFPFGVNDNHDFDINAYQGEPMVAYASTPGSKPLMAVPQFEDRRSDEWRMKLKEAQIPILPPGELGYKILGKMAKRAEFRSEEKRMECEAPQPRTKGEPVTLSEYESKCELASFGIEVPEQCIAHDKSELGAACAKLGFPLVLKINSKDIPHKTDAGGVKLGISSAAAAEEAFDAIMTSCAAYAPEAELDGVLVQRMAKTGREIILGVKNDKLFGPLLLVGMGGVFVEIFKDAVLTPCPLSAAEAKAQLQRLKAFRLLRGYRGSAPCDVDALVELMVKVSEYALANKDVLTEMDINPVFVYPEGEGVCIVDALIIK